MSEVNTLDLAFLALDDAWAFTVHNFSDGARQRHEVHNLAAQIMKVMASLLRDNGSDLRVSFSVPPTGRDAKLRVSLPPRLNAVVPLSLNSESVTIKSPNSGEEVVQVGDTGGAMRLVRAVAAEIKACAVWLQNRQQPLGIGMSHGA